MKFQISFICIICQGLLLISFFIINDICNGQNLVPNSSFEIHTSCPSNEDELSLATPWFNPTNLSPDYFNTCSPNNWVGVPVNFGGTQFPLTGNAYAGVYGSQLLTLPNVREYIRVQLVQPLQSGVNYRVKFYLNLADDCDYGVSSFGAYFSETDTSPMNGYIMNVVPQIQSNLSIPLIDKINWMTVEGTFTALGNEQYITIGNYKNEINSGLYNVSGTMNSAYYYIDDVSVIPDSLTGIGDNILEFYTSVFPNPFTNSLNISTQHKDRVEIIIYDITSRIVIKQTFTGSIMLNTQQFDNGIYIFEVRNRIGIFSKGKLVKN